MQTTKSNRIIPPLEFSDSNRKKTFENQVDLETENYTCFGIMPENSRSQSLKVKFGNGAMLLIQYGRIMSPITFNGTNQIKLSTGTLQMVIQGSNLVPLMDFLGTQRLAWMQSNAVDGETDALFMQGSEPEITAIHIQAKGQPSPSEE